MQQLKIEHLFLNGYLVLLFHSERLTVNSSCDIFSAISFWPYVFKSYGTCYISSKNTVYKESGVENNSDLEEEIPVNCKYSYMKTLVRILLMFSRDSRTCLLLLAFEDMIKNEWKTNISFKKIQIGKQYLPIFQKDGTSTDDSYMLDC